MYVLKIQDRYIAEGPIHFGVPTTVSDFKNARQFTQDEYISFLNTICFDAKIIEI